VNEQSAGEFDELDAAEAPKKGGVPRWVWWGCGGGCLITILAVAVGLFLAAQALKKAADPEVQWPKVAEVLPFDERPVDLKLAMGMDLIVQQQFTFVHRPTGWQVQLTVQGGEMGSQTRYQFFEAEEFVFPDSIPGLMDFGEPVRSTVVVQGRELDMVSLSLEMGGLIQSMAGDETDDLEMGMVFVDLTGEDADGCVYLQITQEGSGGSVTEEWLGEMLAPFQIGPDREVWQRPEGADEVGDRKIRAVIPPPPAEIFLDEEPASQDGTSTDGG